MRHEVLARLQPRLLVTAHREEAAERIRGERLCDARHDHLHLRSGLRTVTVLVLLLPDLPVELSVLLVRFVSRCAVFVFSRGLDGV